ncbi:hypothetical protein HYT55_04385 [Candidatus Woesearchaeota archaeon]|nr:hypothetical protein [Candidatus Woesearchaeota archaeon]
METVSNIGTEYELLVIDREGYISNTAPIILQDPRNKGQFVKEGTKAMVEYNSPPADTITKLHKQTTRDLELLEKICEDNGVTVIAASEYGAGEGISSGNPRTRTYARILGVDGSLRGICAFQGHIDQARRRELAQHQLFTALDPLSIAINSTSPYARDGKNEIACHRVDRVRNIALQRWPLHSRNLPYVSTIKELERQKDLRLLQWGEASGLSWEEFTTLFQRENVGYHPIRKRDSIGKSGTWELRTPDSVPLRYAHATMALYKGINDYMISRSIPVIISTGDEFDLSEKAVVLPRFSQVQKLETEAIQNGFSREIARNTFRLLSFAERGLPQEDQKFLEPLYHMVETGKSPARLLTSHMKRSGYNDRLSPKGAAVANLFMRRMYVQDTLNT